MANKMQFQKFMFGRILRNKVKCNFEVKNTILM